MKKLHASLFATKIAYGTIKKILLNLTICASISLEARIHPHSGVTYALSGGRLGDNLLAVAHAKWLAHCLKLPLVYFPFAYGDQLKLSVDPSVIPFNSFHFEDEYYLFHNDSYFKLWRQLWSEDYGKPSLLQLAYYSESGQDYDPPGSFPTFTQVNWDDPVYIESLRALIAPIAPLPQPQLPADRLTVAIHIRTEVGRDVTAWEIFTPIFPLKGPPYSYYKDALQCLWKAIEKPMYVFIFTDHPNPPELRDRFAQAFQGLDIVFDCRVSGNHHNANVLEDFFALGKFDCLIRADSNYSLVASKLFKYQFEIYPLHYTRNANNEITIDRFMMQANARNEFTRTKTAMYK